MHLEDHELIKKYVRDTSEDMKNMHKKESDICFYCAHHSTMQSLLYAFKLNKMNGFHSPGFGSHLIFELWSLRGDHHKIGSSSDNEDEENSDYFVKFYYDGVYLTETAGEERHTLDKILGISNKVIKNFDKHFVDFAPVKEAQENESKEIEDENEEPSDCENSPVILMQEVDSDSVIIQETKEKFSDFEGTKA